MPELRPALPGMDGGPDTQRIIAFGFALVLLLMVALTVLGLTRLATMKQRMVDLVAEDGARVESVYLMRSLSRERFASLGQIVVLDDPFERDAETMRFHEQAGAFVQARDRLIALGMRPGEQAIWARARQLIRHDQALHDQVLDLAQTGRRQEAMALLMGEVRATETDLLATFNALVDQYHQASQAALVEAETDFRKAERYMLALLGLALLLSLSIAWAVIRRSRLAESALLREHEAAVAAADKLSWAASHDSLTGLANRREMRRRLAELVHRAHARGESHVLLYIDLDHFKQINDRCGHLAGDEALRQVASIFMRHVRGGDLVARVGGDEFCIGLAHCDASKAAGIAEAIRNEVADFCFIWEGQRFGLGASIGLVGLGSQAGVDDALRAADAACYAAKAAGRNQVSGAEGTAQAG
ncbi:MAG: diguanylate cyclase domain-containing protein [Gammaproteobacteria bacterium]